MLLTTRRERLPLICGFIGYLGAGRRWRRNIDKNEAYKYTKEYKSSMVISQELKEILEGVILGDACVIRRHKVSDPVVKFRQCDRNKDYLFHLYEKFEALVATPPRREVVRREKEYIEYAFQTLSFPFLNEYRDRYYDSNGKKIVPRDLEDKLTARSLAFWAMDDGSKSGYRYTLHTEGFSKEDVDYLVGVLGGRFGIGASRKVYRKRGVEYHYILISRGASERYRDLISPYVFGSMKRKL